MPEIEKVVGPLRPHGAPETTAKPRKTEAEFREVLQRELKLSGHAQTRLRGRGIELKESEWDRVNAGVEKAAAKGARESLILVDDVALVISVRNRTVITAVDRENLKENVFTNIDSAVIV